MRILTVEDDPISREVLRHWLTVSGHDVVCVDNGDEALQFLRDDECRLVISDWEMPGMNGLELCRQIRSAGWERYIYVILLTQYTQPHHLVEGLSSGADEFVGKPFDPDELKLRLRTAERILSLETQQMVIFALATLAESKDPETGSHLRRVREYARVLAQELAATERYRDVIDGQFVRLMYLTCPLHDIGKVGIPDHVLLKPGRLSDREFEIMKTHAAQGARTLETALAEYPEAKFLRMARDIASSHHERWDGEGYPDGLAGEEIPLAARIFSLADVYDALVSKRVYKAAFSHDIARNIIVEDSGSHFDPEIVQAFCRRETEFCEIREKYADEMAVC
jgi:putative two-component system response regulator